MQLRTTSSHLTTQYWQQSKLIIANCSRHVLIAGCCMGRLYTTQPLGLNLYSYSNYWYALVFWNITLVRSNASSQYMSSGPAGHFLLCNDYEDFKWKVMLIFHIQITDHSISDLRISLWMGLSEDCLYKFKLLNIQPELSYSKSGRENNFHSCSFF